MRRQRFLTIRILLLLAVATVAPAAEPAQRPETAEGRRETVRIALLHVNDTHGRTRARMVRGRSVGGYARLATLVKRIRKEKDLDGVLLVHAGDLFSRGDATTRRTLGAANVALLNHIGFDAWTPGNGEFYDGLENLKARIAQFDGLVLTSNVRLEKTGKHLASPWAVREIEGVRIGLMGLCFIRRPSSHGLELAKYGSEGARVASILRTRQKVDAVISINHIGYQPDLVVAKLASEIDVIVGGHTHTRLPRGKVVEHLLGGEALIVQAGEHLDYLGRVDLTFRRTEQGGYRLADREAKLIALDQEIPFEASTVEVLKTVSAPKWKPPEPGESDKQTAAESGEADAPGGAAPPEPAGAAAP